MDRHGLAIMAVEIVVLGLLTVAAIGTDGYWTRRAERAAGVGDRESGNRGGAS
jgi:hypothetical protein